MEQFSISDAAFAGFRFVRENPKTVAIWAGLSLAVSAVGGLAMVSLAGPAMTQFMALSQGGSKDPAAALALMGQLAPFYGVMMLFSFVFYAVLYAMMSRAVLRPQDEGFAYLRLGRDEVRQFLLFLLAVLIGTAAYVAFILVVVIVGVAAGMMLGKGLAAGLVAMLIGLTALSGWIYVWVRLSLASPLTFDRGRVDLFGSWKLTRGRFWPLFGCYLLVVVLVVVVLILIMVIGAAAAMVMGGLDGLGQLFRPDMSSVAAYFTPLRALILMVGAIASALFWPVLLMPAAEIYARIVEGDAART
jgi:hypothetical protein